MKQIDKSKYTPKGTALFTQGVSLLSGMSISKRRKEEREVIV